MKYVDVVIDNKSNSTDSFFTYKCEDDSVKVGSKVYVPFARSKNPREGYVVAVKDDASDIDEKVLGKLRSVESVDSEVSLTEEMVRSALWMRGRYLCRYIDAIRCFTPAGSAAVRREKQNSLAGERGYAEPVEALTDEQEEAVRQIDEAIEGRKNERFLIHGPDHREISGQLRRGFRSGSPLEAFRGRALRPVEEDSRGGYKDSDRSQVGCLCACRKPGTHGGR